MELVEGETLEALPRAARPLDAMEATGIAAQVAAGLAAAHAKGIVHRDIKPANVMITPDGLVKVMDFGIAKVPGAAAMTRDGSTLGSSAYMSPEQVRGEPVDARSDLWSLGVVMYELLSGRLPFPGDNEHTVLHKVLTSEPEPLSELRPELPGWLTDTVTRLLSKEPSGPAGISPERCSRCSRGPRPGLLPTATAREAGPRRWRLAPIARWCCWPRSRPPGSTRRPAPSGRHAKRKGCPRLLAMVEAQDCLQAMIRADELERLLPGERALSDARTHCTVPTSILTEPGGADVYLRSTATRRRRGSISARRRCTTSRAGQHLSLAHRAARLRDRGGGHASLGGRAEFEFRSRAARRGARGHGPGPRGHAQRARRRPPSCRRTGSTATRSPTPSSRPSSMPAATRIPRCGPSPSSRPAGRSSTDEAMALLRDATGRPGPANWELGSHPCRGGTHPVTGVSWHEALAYCRWLGKDLPTVFHWRLAAGANDTLFSDILWASNLDGTASVPSARTPASVATAPTTWPATPRNGPGTRWLGGATSSAGRGTSRCTCSPIPTRAAARARLDLRLPLRPLRRAAERRGLRAAGAVQRAVAASAPVSDDIFEVLLRAYAYDDTPLNARVESVDELPALAPRDRIAGRRLRRRALRRASLFPAQRRRRPTRPSSTSRARASFGSAPAAPPTSTYVSLRAAQRPGAGPSRC
jgi:eukaryotic-like serine/threonine-protein kinase